ncbi:MAG: hypothetical protein AAGF11_52030 [Myxococcota bacterium]
MVALLAVNGGSACVQVAAFDCESDAQCTDGLHEGWCESTGFCSFASRDCPSGRRYAPHAGEDLARTCVEEPIEEGSSPSSGDPTDPDLPAISGEGSSGQSTGMVDDSTTGASESSEESSDPSLTTGPVEPTTGMGATDTGGSADPAVFFDDFDRPDELFLGNGWVEKTPTAFQLVDGQVVFESLADGYEDNLWYRDEAVLDVEVCVDFELLQVDSDNHPQVHARIQAKDIDQPSQVTSYILYTESTTLRLRRDIGGSSSRQWTAELASPLNANTWYQLCMRVQGVAPVQLEGDLMVLGEGGWQIHTQVVGQDDDELRLAQPGATGGSGADADQVSNLVYDNFMRTML